MNFGKKTVEMSDLKITSAATEDLAIDGVASDRLLDFLASMLRIRCFEMKIEELSLRGALHGTIHLYIGQEATAVGALAARQPGDLFTSTHRGHGHSVAAGADLVRMFGEFLSKSSGYSEGAAALCTLLMWRPVTSEPTASWVEVLVLPWEQPSFNK